jgi:hypothetical protein
MIATTPQLQPRVDLCDLAEHFRHMTLTDVERNGVAVFVDSLAGAMEPGSGRIAQAAMALRALVDRLGERKCVQVQPPKIEELAARSRIRRLYEACPNVGDSVKLKDVFKFAGKYRSLIEVAMATGDWDMRRERCGEKAPGMPPWTATRIR